ncbi:uncharacterized protein LOC131249153 [Magnolia sinica]|uniref:uncharacterized protein LOC131249153 n=1 Tax=Magnolia sinica TaxID=86752 RepID=UPI0026598867|nr:uncharacterized protein LOC131249153 [Magnolia sinica]
MAKVAIPDPSSSNSFPFGRGASKVQVDATMKRKTPSELRGEQLKRKNYGRPDESMDPPLCSNGTTGGKIRGVKKLESSKTPKYIDTRVDEVYPVKKSSDMFRILYGKEKSRDAFPSSEQANYKESPSVVRSVAAESQSQLPCVNNGASNISDTSTTSYKDDPEQSSLKFEKCSQNTFRSVAELSLGKEMLSGPAIIDMDKALKGMVARELPALSRSPADTSEKIGDFPSLSSGNFCSEVHIPGHKVPLDFTLKTTLRLVSSSSVSWCHRSNTNSAFMSMTLFTSQFGGSRDQHVGNLLGPITTSEVLYSKALHSWTYPQSSLPASVISALTLSAARGETDFLLKRQLAWEDSFRSLYYLLRKNMCDIFYFCTSQFVVMFVGGDLSGKVKRSCNAYLSQSSRGLRSLLREHGIHFSMPLCHSEAEEDTEEDLVELSEIEKHNLGQTRHLDSMSDVDNRSQSLLAFIGNENVHGLFDFLLNYRSFLSSLTSIDVPALCSPVPFENASLHVPEVRCKEVKRANAVLHPLGASHMESTGVCYSVEIKDAILPPWTICGVCAAMGSEGRSFEASFVTEPISSGLNIALDAVSLKSDPRPESNKGSMESCNAFGIPEAAITPFLRSSSLRSLKYSDGSYVASLSPV